MKFLVTGGAGFIGSCVVRRLVAEGEEVVTLDCLTYAGHRESLGEALTAPNHRLAEVNIRDAQGVRRVFAEERPDIVMHLAAESHVDRSIDNPLDFVTTNVLGTVTLLKNFQTKRSITSQPPFAVALPGFVIQHAHVRDLAFS